MCEVWPRTDVFKNISRLYQSARVFRVGTTYNILALKFVHQAIELLRLFNVHDRATFSDMRFFPLTLPYFINRLLTIYGESNKIKATFCVACKDEAACFILRHCCWTCSQCVWLRISQHHTQLAIRVIFRWLNAKVRSVDVLQRCCWLNKWSASSWKPLWIKTGNCSCLSCV